MHCNAFSSTNIRRETLNYSKIYESSRPLPVANRRESFYFDIVAGNASGIKFPHSRSLSPLVPRFQTAIRTTRHSRENIRDGTKVASLKPSRLLREPARRRKKFVHDDGSGLEELATRRTVP